MAPFVFANTFVAVVNMFVTLAIYCAMISGTKPMSPDHFVWSLLVSDAIIWLIAFFAAKQPHKSDRERRPWLYHK